MQLKIQLNARIMFAFVSVIENLWKQKEAHTS